MELEKYRERIEKYLAQEKYINVVIKKEELENEEIERYLALLAILGEKKEYVDKFSGKMSVSFEGYESGPFINENLIKVVKRFCDICPYLFYFLDKETATIKDFTIAYCGTGTVDGDDHAVDRTIFEAFLKHQLQGMVVLAAKHNLHPDKLEEAVKQVYDYFGLN
ncbi:MAG: hypothetical protein AB9883_09980 [Acidaminococcaceae bacterium]